MPFPVVLVDVVPVDFAVAAVETVPQPVSAVTSTLNIENVIHCSSNREDKEVFGMSIIPMLLSALIRSRINTMHDLYFS
ncbi:hypothetical protein [Terriglobus roseus]|uniref:hypothetical protein n=1 Tax=Terriglobus roseus TaxID=392734 RepID=UPI00147B126E|nr:hypothetical protein [Terriglobus roseus]